MEDVDQLSAVKWGLRRLISILLYCAAAMLLPFELMFAFAADPDPWLREILLWLTGGPFILLIVVGALISPAQSRRRELGMVLLASTALGVAVIGTVVWWVWRTSGSVFADDASKALMSGYTNGIANVVALATVGILLIRFSSRRDLVKEATLPDLSTVPTEKAGLVFERTWKSPEPSSAPPPWLAKALLLVLKAYGPRRWHARLVIAEARLEVSGESQASPPPLRERDSNQKERQPDPDQFGSEDLEAPLAEKT